MESNAYPRLHALYEPDAEDPRAAFPSEDELAGWLEDIARAAARRNRISASLVDWERQARAAARFCLEGYDYDHPVYVKARERRTKARPRGKGKKHDANLKRLRKLQEEQPGISKAKAAEALGVSTSTIANWRKELKAMAAQELQAELDALMPLEPTSEELDALLAPAPTPQPACSAQALLAALDKVPPDGLFDDIDLDAALPAPTVLRRPAASPKWNVFADLDLDLAA